MFLGLDIKDWTLILGLASVILGIISAAKRH